MRGKPSADIKRYRWIIAMLAILLLTVFLASFFVGRFQQISLIDILKILINQIRPVFAPTWNRFAENVVIQLRLPRMIASVLVGAALSSAGTAYQALFSNPMASPDTLGVSSGAGLGAATAILLGAGSVAIQINAFTFGCISVIGAFLVAMLISRGKNATVFLVLTGMVISAFLSGLLSILKYVADPMDELPTITYWLMGSFASTNINDVLVLGGAFVIGFVPLFLIRWRMNLLTLSDSEARALGENTALLRVITIICSTMLTAASISVAGGVSWVGLIVPHIARLLVGDDFKKVLPTAALFGGIYLLIMDDLSRGLIATGIPIGILTSIVGAPLFFVILIRNRRAIVSDD